MMSRQGRSQPKLFYTGFDLDSRIRSNHPLRRIAQVVDFDFVYDEVDELYGTNGNPSVPPPVILKLMLLLVFYNVRSERELLDTLPERIDWLWFLGFDLDSPVPNHSVLSKARMRWGEHLQFTAEANPGDFIFIPPYVPHQEINASPDQVLECVLVRSDGEAIAINLDIEPVEKPETVLWVDPIHRDIAAKK